MGFMGFMTFLAVIGLVMSAFLIGFSIGSIRESEIGADDVTASESNGANRRRMAVGFKIPAFLIVTSLMLIEPAAISPLWLQFVLFAASPALIGYVSRRLLARYLASA